MATPLILAFPLLWPAQRPHTPPSQRTTPPGFKADMSYAEAIGHIKQELADRHYENATLHTCYDNVENDRTRKRMDTMHGASLLLRLHGVEYLLACDSWTLTQQNIYAIYLTLYGLHQLDRWQTASMDMLLRGFLVKDFTAPAHDNGTHTEAWREALGLGPSARLADANATYRARAKEMAHDQAALMNLNQAIEEARKMLR